MRARRIRNGGAAALALAVLLSGCAQPLSTREKSALVGGGLGAATGAIIGGAVGNPGAGVALGGVLGAGAGALVGDQLQKRDVQEAEQRHEMERQSREIERQRTELQLLEHQPHSETDEY